MPSSNRAFRMQMSDEYLRQLDIRNARFSQREQMNLIREYAELRQLLRNPYATMKVYVLEPLCEYCRFGRMPMEESDHFVPLSQPIHPPRENCYMYPALFENRPFYAAAQGILLREADGHEISCTLCHEDLSDETILYVSERSFQDYFCLQDESNGIPKWLRKHILDCYGRTCFECGAALISATLSIDHIVPRSRGGDNRPSNLQALCVRCNNRKNDFAPEAAHIFLDFLARPVPSESYSELIW